MSFREGWTYRELEENPKCLFCDVSMRPAVIIRGEDYLLRGWRCPKCGFTLIHPHEIPKALELLRAMTKTTQPS
jgi:tRNA(Ile2) C34 agmatinyltransferase TiaS